MAVGGIKEKLIAAKAADINCVILPDANRPGMSRSLQAHMYVVMSCIAVHGQ